MTAAGSLPPLPRSRSLGERDDRTHHAPLRSLGPEACRPGRPPAPGGDGPGSRSRPGAGHPPAPGGRAYPPLLRPAAAVVPGPAGARQRGLQPPGRRAPGGAPGRGRAGGAPWTPWWPATRPCAPPSPPPRGARCRWSPRRLAVPLPVVDLSALPPAAREAAVVARAQAEAGAPFDLAAGPCCGGPAAPGPGGARAAADPAPHRRRRLVDGGLHPGAGRALRRHLPRRRARPAGAAGAVRGLRRLAARVAAGGRCWRGSWPTGGQPWPALPPLELPADRPRPATPSSRGATARAVFPVRADRRPEAPGGGGGGDAVHGPAGGLPGPAGRATAGRPTWRWGPRWPTVPGRSWRG